MQFPLRDFFWLTVVIALVIGIAMERKRVQELSGYQGRAEWWEKAARGLGEKFEEKTGQPVHIEEMKSIEIWRGRNPHRVKATHPITGEIEYYEVNLPPGVVDHVHPGYVRDTRERDLSWVTGLLDLDFFLVTLVAVGPVLGIYLFWRKGPLPSGLNDPKAEIWKRPSLILFMICYFAPFSVFQYWNRSPINGAAFLILAVVWSYYYCQFVLTPKLDGTTANSTTTSAAST
jgi:hypothetical protein